jgi:predicted dehydrogenase
MYQRDYPTKIRVGIVGVGSHMYRNLLPAVHHLPLQIVAMCSRGPERLERTIQEYRCAGYLSSKEMYEKENLDAVIISVSPEQHPDLVCEALEHGLHVFLEKPPAVRVHDIDRMIAQRKDRVVVVGFKKVFMPAAQKAYEVINSTRYGNLKSILAMYPIAIPENGEEILASRTFTNWLGNGCHPLSLMIATGGNVVKVTTHKSHAGYGSVVLEYENGILGNLHLASGPQPIEEYHFYGEQWHLAIQNNHRVVLQRGIPFDYANTWNFAPEGDESGAVVWEPQNSLSTLENKSLFIQGVVQELKYFCDCILDHRQQNLGSLEFARQVMQVYEAALISNGKTISIS